MIIPAGYAQCNLRFIGEAVPLGAEVTFGVALGDPEPTPAAAGLAVGSAWVSNILPYQSTLCILSQVRVKFGPNDTGPFAEVAFANAGASTGDAVSPQVSVLAEKTTLFGGRQGRGRMYIPGFPEAAIDSGGDLELANVTAMNDALADFLAALATADLAMSLLHGSGATPPYGVVALTVDPQVATQRRRNRR